MANITVKRVPKDRLNSEIEDKQVEGYSLQSRSDNVAIMKRGGKLGSFWIHIILLLFTAGIGNVIYGIYNYSKTKAEVHIKAEEMA